MKINEVWRKLSLSQKSVSVTLLFLLLILPISLMVALRPVIFRPKAVPVTPPVTPIPGRVNRIGWNTGHVSLSASNFYIRLPHRYYPESIDDLSIDSDPLDSGDPLYTTLEITWFEENDIEMRINLYFRSNGTEWWLYEARTYNGSKNADWIYYPIGIEKVRRPVGESFIGDLTLHSNDLGGTNASLHFDNLLLYPFFNQRTPTPTPKTPIPTPSAASYIMPFIPQGNPGPDWSTARDLLKTLTSNGYKPIYIYNVNPNDRTRQYYILKEDETNFNIKSGYGYYIGFPTEPSNPQGIYQVISPAYEVNNISHYLHLTDKGYTTDHFIGIPANLLEHIPPPRNVKALCNSIQNQGSKVLHISIMQRHTKDGAPVTFSWGCNQNFSGPLLSEYEVYDLTVTSPGTWSLPPTASPITPTPTYISTPTSSPSVNPGGCDNASF